MHTGVPYSGAARGPDRACRRLRVVVVALRVAGLAGLIGEVRLLYRGKLVVLLVVFCIVACVWCGAWALLSECPCAWSRSMLALCGRVVRRCMVDAWSVMICAMYRKGILVVAGLFFSDCFVSLLCFSLSFRGS